MLSIYLSTCIYNIPTAWFPDAQLQLLPSQLSPGDGASDASSRDSLAGCCGSGRKQLSPTKNWISPTKISGWWFEPLWKIWKSIGMIRNPIYGKIKNVPNHQQRFGLNNQILGLNPAKFDVGYWTIEATKNLGKNCQGKPRKMLMHASKIETDDFTNQHCNLMILM